MKYSYTFLLLSIVPVLAEPVVKPTVTVSPVSIFSSYGEYFGGSVSGGVIIRKSHTLLGTIDIAPWGSVGFEDISTNGEETYYGGTLAYQYKFRINNDLFKIAPGVATGISSIPYLYGTLSMEDLYVNPEAHRETNPRVKPDRETIVTAGPDMSIEIGRKNLNLFTRGRVLFTPGYTTTFLLNTGISYQFGSIDSSGYEASRERMAARHLKQVNREIIRLPKGIYTSAGGTVSTAVFNSHIPEVKGTIPYFGGELEVGKSWDTTHLLYGNFTADYNWNNDMFGGGIGYSYSLVDLDKFTLRVGGIAGFWLMTTAYTYYNNGKFQHKNQHVPYFAGPTIRFEVGRFAPRLFVKDQLLLGAGIFNSVTAGIAIDLTRRRGE